MMLLSTQSFTRSDAAVLSSEWKVYCDALLGRTKPTQRTEKSALASVTEGCVFTTLDDQSTVVSTRADGVAVIVGARETSAVDQRRDNRVAALLRARERGSVRAVAVVHNMLEDTSVLYAPPGLRDTTPALQSPSSSPPSFVSGAGIAGVAASADRRAVWLARLLEVLVVADFLAAVREGTDHEEVAASAADVVVRVRGLDGECRLQTGGANGEALAVDFTLTSKRHVGVHAQALRRVAKRVRGVQPVAGDDGVRGRVRLPSELELGVVRGSSDGVLVLNLNVVELICGDNSSGRHIDGKQGCPLVDKQAVVDPEFDTLVNGSTATREASLKSVLSVCGHSIRPDESCPPR
eukprot:1131096-Rhodomonas_salina.4